MFFKNEMGGGGVTSVKSGYRCEKHPPFIYCMRPKIWPIHIFLHISYDPFIYCDLIIYLVQIFVPVIYLSEITSYHIFSSKFSAQSYIYPSKFPSQSYIWQVEKATHSSCIYLYIGNDPPPPLWLGGYKYIK